MIVFKYITFFETIQKNHKLNINLSILNIIKRCCLIKKIIPLILLLVLPLAVAENFDSYASLVLESTISGKVDFLKEGSDPSLENFNVDIFLFPKDNFQQKVLNREIISNPKYSSFSRDDSQLTLIWEDSLKESLTFEIKTELEVKNDFQKVLTTVEFPLYNLPPELQKYTQSTEHIDIDSKIKAKANQLVSGETDLFMAVYRIGSWVKNNIAYDLNTLTAEADQKATWVFRNRRGVCDEITNLFLAMLRSVNIPSRFVSGTVYSNLDNNFGNHGWAEVYFPGYGWIPFDVTFGQYGWIDPTHIKMEHSLDSGGPSIEFRWKARDTKVDPSPLEFNTEIKEKKGKISSYVNIEIKPLKSKVGFGSYIPIEVTLQNLKDYYIPVKAILTKAPKLIGNNNIQSIVLKPQEKRRIYWMIQIPPDLDKDYIYTSELEVKNNFGGLASDIIKSASSFEFFSKEWAQKTMDRLKVRDTKFFFSNLDFVCVPDKNSYYSDEEADITCTLMNAGNVKLEGLNVCLPEGCKRISLGIGDKREVHFFRSLSKTEIVTLSAENENMVKYADVKLNVVEIPDLQVLDISPKSIDYNEESILVISLATESPAYNVEVHVENFGEGKWDELSEKRFLKIPFSGKDVFDGDIQIKMVYEDALGKVYSNDLRLPITVSNVPSYLKIWIWFKELLIS